MAKAGRPSRSRRRSRFHKRMISRSFSASIRFTRGFCQCERKENKAQAARNSVRHQGPPKSRDLRAFRLRKNARWKRVMAFEPAVTLDRVDRTLPLDEAPQSFGET